MKDKWCKALSYGLEQTAIRPAPASLEISVYTYHARRVMERTLQRLGYSKQDARQIAENGSGTPRQRLEKVYYTGKF